MTGKEMLRLLKKNGFWITKTDSSHHYLTNGEKTTCIPIHGKQELKKGTQEAILKQAGLK